MKHYLIVCLLAIAIAPCLCAIDQYLLINKHEEKFEIPLTEDLMREHGILNRILLIYEEIIKRIENNNNFPICTLINATDIIKSFIENYHEKLEEEYVFPIFEKYKKQIRLIKTLKDQHNKGREITTQLQKLLTKMELLDQQSKDRIKNLLQSFITMYRPHEAREDTILFPQIRTLISEQEFQELGETFERREHELFGKSGFKKMVKKVENIEKELGIYQLEQFTPDLEK